jgi:hypothetical protein
VSFIFSCLLSLSCVAAPPSAFPEPSQPSP